ncbi:hypothetical protein [Actinoplanes sp. L3-i22]|uniref:hypothetical protein n=1 Tax=Actinoplanes sp. L3-i22 TaxID=2836373 RepID=UPI001C79A092|nr:hypothetical protein [Actinoplanes sp. L3-i22]BCY11484.1 hypothetical protein L3i22_065720 [Actinoplanes sp. L3-i22]
MAKMWVRRVVIGVSCAPLVLVSVLHTMGRSGDFGVLGRWYVLTGLAVAGFLAWGLVERAIGWATRPGE